MLQRSIRVPSHWPLEIVNALRTRIRAGKISADVFATMMDRLDRLDIEVEPPMDLDEIGPTTNFARAHVLTAYDAVHVQLALRHGAALATVDRAMRTAARALNIALLPA